MNRANTGHYNIAIVTGNTQSDYSVKLLDGAFAAANEEDVNVILLTEQEVPSYCADIITGSKTGNYRYQFYSVYQYADYIKPDAAIITCGSISQFSNDEQKKRLLSKFSDIPYILLEEQPKDEDEICLSTDNYAGMKECVEHLIADHGYKKITYLSGPASHPDARIRLQAYLDAMKEHNLTVTDTMIAYGDYTNYVEDKALYLLEHNPGIEAIVAANDAMATSCYRACTSNNLIVGKDIAITGFDDISAACTMNPPLTSVSQDVYQLAYEAVKRAVSICMGNREKSGYLPTILQKRGSCGCAEANFFAEENWQNKSVETFIQELTHNIAPNIFASIYNKKEYRHLEKALEHYFNYIYETVFLHPDKEYRMEYLLEDLKKLTVSPRLSNALLQEKIVQGLQVLGKMADSSHAKEQITSIISTTQQFLSSIQIKKLEQEIAMSDRKAWFVPTFTRDLVSEVYMSDMKSIFYHVMTELQKMIVRSAYFFLYDKPIIHEPDELISFPEQIGLTAYFDSREMKFYKRGEQPRFSNIRGFMQFIDGKEAVTLVPVVLFSGKMQYGIALCDVNREDISFIQICCLQIGTLLHFFEMSRMEQQAQLELQNSLSLIEEKNNILSFLSEYDELTKLMNRRGFFEKALDLYKCNYGKMAYLIEGDLDHLKEINDEYGHAEGDFAIQNVAERFISLLPEHTICGRLGGDEYIAFVVTEEEDFETRIKAAFDKAGREFNDSCKKPYYIEVSMGIRKCTCNQQTDFNEVIKQADIHLYEAKKHRRKSVKR